MSFESHDTRTTTTTK
ncbi:unnamed protein product [Debaryomyces tyrocola]|nr:unnamed protein product [Debaryomyces tyrocola]